MLVDVIGQVEIPLFRTRHGYSDPCGVYMEPQRGHGKRLSPGSLYSIPYLPTRKLWCCQVEVYFQPPTTRIRFARTHHTFHLVPFDFAGERVANP